MPDGSYCPMLVVPRSWMTLRPVGLVPCELVLSRGVLPLAVPTVSPAEVLRVVSGAGALFWLWALAKPIANAAKREAPSIFLVVLRNVFMVSGLKKNRVQKTKRCPVHREPAFQNMLFSSINFRIAHFLVITFVCVRRGKGRG